MSNGGTSDDWATVFATAHRDVPAAGERWTRDNLGHCARWLRDNRSTRVGISGMARGGDLWWAQAVLDAGLDLWAFIPFPEQAATWSKRDRADWQAIRDAAARIHIVGTIPEGVPPAGRSTAVNRLLWQRNDEMLEAADACVGVWVPGRRSGGTHGCLTKAARLRMPGVHLDPQACGVRHRLPTLAELGPRERRH